MLQVYMRRKRQMVKKGSHGVKDLFCNYLEIYGQYLLRVISQFFGIKLPKKNLWRNNYIQLLQCPLMAEWLKKYNLVFKKEETLPEFCCHTICLYWDMLCLDASKMLSGSQYLGNKYLLYPMHCWIHFGKHMVVFSCILQDLG